MQFLTKDISTDFKPWQSSMRRFLGKEVRKYAVMIALWTNATGTADSVFLRPPRLLPKLAGLIVTPFPPDCSRDASEIDPGF
jgi:hypothetical protein